MSKQWFLVLALLCTIALALSIFWMVWPQYLEPPVSSSAPYLLMDDGGKLALFPAGSKTPVAIYDVYTRLLPENDLLDLQKGIPVADEAELHRLLEDFGL